MAFEGELVKMENGRWARFQALRICNAGHQDTDDTTILVAVELEEHFQDVLAEAEGAWAKGAATHPPEPRVPEGPRSPSVGEPPRY